MNIPIYYDLLLRISTSSMKVVLPTTQEPGVGAKKYKIQFPVCSTWITQVPPTPPTPTHPTPNSPMKCKVNVVFYEQFILPKLIISFIIS